MDTTIDPRIEKLNRIGIALSSETDIDRLLALIVSEARGFTQADAGSLYTLEADRLFFRVAQNDTLNKSRGGSSSFKPHPIALDTSSIAGYVALKGEVLHIEDVYFLSQDAPYSFNKSFDQENGYRSQSMLVVPMKDPEGQVLGVLQLINAQDGSGKVTTFSPGYQTLTMSLASQAAVALRNARLIYYIKSLFEALIKYSASAIDARSPHTAGHSRRVAAYALAIARQMDKETQGPFADVFFPPERLDRLKYAAWLHDMGKIGVPEQILDKRWRLPVGQEEVIKSRFGLAAACKALEAAGQLDGPGAREVLAAEQARLNQALERILKINASNWLPDEDLEFLQKMQQETFVDPDGNGQPLLKGEEMHYLTVKKGNLTPEEYQAMQGHVDHTLKIVRNIPFTGHLQDVPIIAASHHEMINGTGYPRKLSGDAVGLEARILAMVDIFDALTAMDRPYRRAIPPEKAAAILQSDVEAGRLDKDVVALFVSRRLWEQADKEKQEL